LDADAVDRSPTPAVARDHDNWTKHNCDYASYSPLSAVDYSHWHEYVRQERSVVVLADVL